MRSTTKTQRTIDALAGEAERRDRDAEVRRMREAVTRSLAQPTDDEIRRDITEAKRRCRC